MRPILLQLTIIAALVQYDHIVNVKRHLYSRTVPIQDCLMKLEEILLVLKLF
jgi:hypothetical protein